MISLFVCINVQITPVITRFSISQLHSVAIHKLAVGRLDTDSWLANPLHQSRYHVIQWMFLNLQRLQSILNFSDLRGKWRSKLWTFRVEVENGHSLTHKKLCDYKKRKEWQWIVIVKKVITIKADRIDKNQKSILVLCEILFVSISLVQSLHQFTPDFPKTMAI